MKHLVIIPLIVFSSYSWSNTISQSFQATANVSSACAVTTTDVNFGEVSFSISEQSSNVVLMGHTSYEQNTTFDILCSKGVSALINISSTNNFKLTSKNPSNPDTITYTVVFIDQHQQTYSDGMNILGNGIRNSGKVVSTLDFNKSPIMPRPDIYHDNVTVSLSY
jgi:hypothetical protein